MNLVYMIIRERLLASLTAPLLRDVAAACGTPT
jgi:hypothetical protein